MVLDLGKHIADLLREHNRVSLPGIGAFVGNYKPAILNEETLELSPPNKEITFSKDETWNDGLLENQVSQVEELSIEEAKQAVADSIAEAVIELQKNGSYALLGLGQLVKEGWSITFELEEGVNLLSDAYGLETISMPIPTIQPEKNKVEPLKSVTAKPIIVAAPIAPKPANRAQSKSKTTWILLGLFSVILILAGYLYFDGSFTTTPVAIQANVAPSVSSDSDSVDTTLAEDYTDTIDVDTAEQKIVAETIDSKTEKRKALYYEEPKAAGNGVKTFYIIAGSFNKMENAEKLKDALVKEGFKPQILTVEGPVFRVSMYSFTNQNRALQELARLRNQNKERNVWLLGL